MVNGCDHGHYHVLSPVKTRLVTKQRIYVGSDEACELLKGLAKSFAEGAHVNACLQGGE